MVTAKGFCFDSKGIIRSERFVWREEDNGWPNYKQKGKVKAIIQRRLHQLQVYLIKKTQQTDIRHIKLNQVG